MHKEYFCRTNQRAEQWSAFVTIMRKPFLKKQHIESKRSAVRALLRTYFFNQT